MIESYEPIIRILNALYSWTPTIELEPTPASVFRSHNWEWHKLCHNLCHSQNVNAFWRHKCSCFQHSNDLPVTPRATDVIFDCFKRKLETFFVQLGLIRPRRLVIAILSALEITVYFFAYMTMSSSV